MLFKLTTSYMIKFFTFFLLFKPTEMINWTAEKIKSNLIIVGKHCAFVWRPENFMNELKLNNAFSDYRQRPFRYKDKQRRQPKTNEKKTTILTNLKNETNKVICCIFLFCVLSCI